VNAEETSTQRSPRTQQGRATPTSQGTPRKINAETGEEAEENNAEFAGDAEEGSTPRSWERRGNINAQIAENAGKSNADIAGNAEKDQTQSSMRTPMEHKYRVRVNPWPYSACSAFSAF
jgi:hypothetical protein